MKFLGIRQRILLAVLVPTALVAALLSFMLIQAQNDHLRSEQNHRLIAVAHQISSAAEVSIYSENLDNLKHLIDSALAEPDITGAAFLNADGQLLVSSLPADQLPLPSRVVASLAAPTDTAPDQYWHAQPIVSFTHGDARLDDPELRTPLHGLLLIRISTVAVRAETRRLVQRAAALSSLLLLLGIGLSFMLSRTLVRSLEDIRQVVGDIGQGNLAARTKNTGNDELGLLAQGINQMAEAVGQTQEELAARIAKATATLRQERDEAALAAQSRSRFFTAAGHDLRQPLQAIGLFASRLERDASLSELKPQLQELSGAITNLQSLLDALLDYSRLEGKVFRVEFQAVHAPQAIGYVLANLEATAAEKGLYLRSRITDCWFETDSALLYRILLNLVGNAVKYTANGGILVTCRRSRGFARIEVWDTGPGIPEEFHEQVFEELVQLQNNERDFRKGLGLGLAIARRAADLLGHPLTLCSRVGHGSRFALHIPLSQPPATDMETGEATSKPLLLLALGAQPRCELAATLESWGYVVDTATHFDAAEAIILGGTCPRLIIIELGKNRPCPEQTCAWLARISSCTGIALPLLIIGDGPMPDNVGAPTCLWLTRPYRPARLRALMTRLLEQAGDEGATTIA